MNVPSTVPERQPLGILHIWIDLTVLEESVGIEDMCVGIDRFITKNRPSQCSAGQQNNLQKPRRIPCVVHDCSTGRDEPTLIYIILH